MEEPIDGFRMMLKWEKLESVNSMYTRTRRGMTLSPAARKFKAEVGKQVRKQLPKKLPFTNKDVFKLSLHFILNSRFFVRDTSNFIKLVEDCIFDELDINDARNLELDCRKSFLKDSKYEYIKVTVEKSDFNYNYFNEEVDNEKDSDKKASTKCPVKEDRMYSLQEVEQIYTRGLFDSLKWHLHESLPQPQEEVKKPKKRKP